MPAADERIRTTHIGSLPRTAELLELLERRASGEPVDDDTFDDAVEAATRRVIRRQAEVGIDIANDGEQSRPGFNIYVTDRLSGFDGRAPAPFWSDIEAFPGYAAEFNYPDPDPETGAPVRPSATGPVEHVDEERTRRELEAFDRLLDDEDPGFEGTFITAPSPGSIATSLTDQYYGDHEEYLFALADALHTEYRLIAESGFDLQVDAPDLLNARHRAFAELSTREYVEVARTHVEAINEALRDVPAEVVRLHTCWGNYEGPHHLDVPLEAILPELYEADVAGLAIEQASPRHGHEYRAFEEHGFPTGWDLLPGVVDVKTYIVDHPEYIADRLERFASIVGDPSRLIAAPDCGFGTLAWKSRVEDITWEKLRALREGADLATERVT